MSLDRCIHNQNEMLFNSRITFGNVLMLQWFYSSFVFIDKKPIIKPNETNGKFSQGQLT